MSVCVACGANRVRRRAVKQRRRDGRPVMAPAFVSNSCGERVFDLKTLNMLAARLRKNRRRVIRVMRRTMRASFRASAIDPE
ncbi:MAG: hypothetical protein HUU22_10785 [Phycisphaerae bacterium]|nr:hypothetical protein [Phycisphaerae bacterium]